MAMPVAERQVSRGDIATAVAVLRQRFGERLQTGAEIRRQHANTITWIPNQPPDAVIWVESTDEVRQVVEIARTHGVPIVPFGGGSGVLGGAVPPGGSLFTRAPTDSSFEINRARIVGWDDPSQPPPKGQAPFAYFDFYDMTGDG